MSEFMDVCERAARAGGAALKSWIGRFEVREKGPADLVTDADLASQEAVRSVVSAAFPDHNLLSEEEPYLPGGNSEYRWIVDPLDGTTNYVHQVPQYAVSIALEYRDEVICGTVYDPSSDECFSAERGCGAYLNGKRLKTSGIQHLSQALVAVSFAAKVRRDAPIIKDFVEVLMRAQAIRRTGSAAINLAYVAAGRFDAYWAKETKAWDVAAGILLVREAGGTVTAVDGSPFRMTHPRFVAAASAELHAELLPLVKQRVEPLEA